MMINKTAYVMIRAAVNKGIVDIKENPERGIRNLVDLGVQFAKGRFQQDFFDMAQNELLNTDSAYYRLIADVIGNTDTALLTNIGMNVGYISWNAGANMIRKIEKSEKFNIPWTIVFDLAKWQQFDINIPGKIISESKELGIFCHIFFINRYFSPVDMDQLLNLIAKEKCVTFFLMLDPAQVNEKLIRTIHKSKNIFTAVDCDQDVASFNQAIALLKKNNCFFGSLSHQLDPEDEDAILAASCQAEASGIPFLFMAQNTNPVFDSAHGNEAVYHIRKNMRHAVLPIDLYDDIIRLDRIISSEPCIVHANEDGTITALRHDNSHQKSEQSILSSPLKEMFRSLLAKQKG